MYRQFRLVKCDRSANCAFLVKSSALTHLTSEIANQGQPLTRLGGSPGCFWYRERLLIGERQHCLFPVSSIPRSPCATTTCGQNAGQKARFGCDSSTAPYFMGAHRHDFDAGAVAPACYLVSSKSRRTHEDTLVRLSPPPLDVN